jgi:polysaccharide biosynthesis protein PslH
MNDTLDILQISPRLPWPAVDGGTIGIFHITRALARRGHRVTFATFARPDADAGELADLADVHALAHDTSTRAGGLLLNLFSGLPYTISKYQAPAMHALLAGLCDERRFDVVHVDHIHMAPYGAALSEFLQLPWVLREHNFETTIYERFGASLKLPLARAYMGMQSRRLRRFEAAQLDRADVCAAITDEDAARIREVSHVDVRVIPAGVDVERITVTDRERADRAHVVILGSLAWEPNADGVRWFVQEVWPRVTAREPDAVLTIAGAQPPAWLRALASPALRAPGFVEDIDALLASATLTAVPLRVGGGMRVKLLEYFARGEAVVSTTIGAEGNAARHGQELLLADEPAAFADAVLDLIADRDRRGRLGDSARQLVETRYSWDAIGAAFEEAYRSAIDKRRGAV